jgi:hypothetical protein
MSNEVHLMWDDSVLTIAPSFPELEKFLTYKEKSLEQDKKNPYKRVTKVKTVPLYKEINNKNGYKVIQTMQGLWLKVKTYLEEQGYTVKFYDMRLKFQAPRLDLMTGFRFKQQELLTEFLQVNCSGLLGAPTRYGKCYSLDTPILMADGTTKMVQDVKNGDEVMGPDSTPRKVSGTCCGEDVMYKIIPNQGSEPFICTQDHTLVLYRTSQGGKNKSPNLDKKVFTIPLNEYINKSSNFKHLHKLIRASLEFRHKDVINPYVYGVWLGDGTTDCPEITTMDEEVVEELNKICSELNGRLSVKERKSRAATYRICGDGVNRSPFFDLISKSSDRAGKFILKDYIINSKEVRLQTLAGIIDSDGYLNNGMTYDITTKFDNLKNDILFLARSLGFKASARKVTKKISKINFSGEYWCIGISGPIHRIPVRIARKKAKVQKSRVNPLVTGFEVEYVGLGKYYGFQIDNPDGLFLLGDCTVTHNTTLIKNTIRAFPNVNTVVTVPGADLVKQLYDDIKAAVPHREVKLIGAGSNKAPCDDINVVSMDSLHKCDADACRLLLIDEPHASVTNSRLPELSRFDKARRIGFGATLKGRFDQKDILIEALIGPVLAERTFKEAVAEGAVCPITVYMVVIPMQGFLADRDVAYKKCLFQSDKVAKVVKWICHELLPKDWQTLLFIKNEKQAEFFLDWVGSEGTIAMAKRLTKTEREDLMRRMCSDEIKRCLASDIYAQGVTFNHVRALINLSGGGANTSTIQKPGRLAEVRPNKKCGVVFDFFFSPQGAQGEGATALYRESKARLQAYAEKGYDVAFVSGYGDLENSFRAKAL